MIESEVAAHALVSRLRSAGVEAHVTGAGVHWQVDVEGVAFRSLRVHCFWYERAIAGLMHGINPANARSRLRETPLPYEGLEYLVILNQRGVRVADGRTHDAAEVVACSSAWLAHGDLERVARVVPFIGEKERAMRALAGQLDPTLRWEIGSDPVYELWVYGGDRSCNFMARDGALSCTLFLGQAQVAHGTDPDDVPGAVAAWLIARVPVRTLAAHVRAVELERYAEVLETDPPRWHWLHIRDRIANPSDVLAPLRDLIERLATSPVATTFYSYSSLNRFCFSASSHYPWIDHSLPVVAPADEGTYVVGEKLCDLDGAVRLIESELEAFPIRPFFGSAPHYELPLLAECLAGRGSALGPQLEQHGAWYYLVVTNAAGTRRCKVSACHVTFLEAADRLEASWPTLDDAVTAICRFCEGGASLDEIGADPRVHPGSQLSC